MSMLEVSDGKENVQKKFKALIDFAKGLGYETDFGRAPAIFSN